MEQLQCKQASKQECTYKWRSEASSDSIYSKSILSTLLKNSFNIHSLNLRYLSCNKWNVSRMRRLLPNHRDPTTIKSHTHTHTHTTNTHRACKHWGTSHWCLLRLVWAVWNAASVDFNLPYIRQEGARHGHTQKRYRDGRTFPRCGIGAINGPSVSRSILSNGTSLTTFWTSWAFLNVMTPVNPIQRLEKWAKRFLAKARESVKQWTWTRQSCGTCSFIIRSVSWQRRQARIL